MLTLGEQSMMIAEKPSLNQEINKKGGRVLLRRD